MGNDVVVGGLCFHEKLGIGKIISLNDGVAEVIFLFFWPAVRVDVTYISSFVPDADPHNSWQEQKIMED